MKKCPLCNNFMSWFSTSFYFENVGGWNCSCGYSTIKQTIKYSNSIELKEENNNGFRKESC